MAESAFAHTQVSSLQHDSKPNVASDRLPEPWMIQLFGTDNPSASPLFASSAVFDGDGINILDEFRIGTNPADSDSRLEAMAENQLTSLRFVSTPGELYTVETETNLRTWIDAILPITARATNVVVSNFMNADADLRFFRLRFPEQSCYCSKTR